MNPRLARLLTRSYSLAWRKRYGAEFEALLETGRGDFRTLGDVVWSAVCERITTGGLAMNQHPYSREFQSWCIRAPWAIFGLAPLLLLAAAYLVACLYLWTGWQVFLPGADSPFGIHPNGPIYGFANLYFQAGKFFYFTIPVLVGWAIGLIATRQRVKALWPAVGLILIAWIGASAQIYAGRTAVPNGLGHIRMDFVPQLSLHGFYESLLRTLVIFSIAALPWLVWRWRTHSLPA